MITIISFHLRNKGDRHSGPPCPCRAPNPVNVVLALVGHFEVQNIIHARNVKTPAKKWRHINIINILV